MIVVSHLWICPTSHNVLFRTETEQSFTFPTTSLIYDPVSPKHSTLTHI
jgi:hypothetical protein